MLVIKRSIVQPVKVACHLIVLFCFQFTFDFVINFDLFNILLITQHRSKWKFMHVTTLLPMKRFVWRSSAACAAAWANRLTSALCFMR